jgi:hypothetical protein
MNTLDDYSEYIENLLAEEREKVIGYISEKEGWEETGDKYRLHFGIKQKYIKEYEGTQGTIKINLPTPVKHRIVIHNAGEFFLNDNNKLDFEGDAEEAGRLFAEYVSRCYNEYIENLLSEERKKVLEDCIETLLGCDENCEECEADNPRQEIWCPYKEKLEQLREKYKGVE